MSEIVTTPTKINKAALIRALLKDGTKTRAQIAEEVGCKVQYVFSVQHHEKAKKAKAKAKRAYERKLQRLAGAPKRPYVKSGKYAKKVQSPLDVPPVIKTQYIEVEVPQPHYNLTWKQRLVALFTGRV